MRPAGLTGWLQLAHLLSLEDPLKGASSVTILSYLWLGHTCNHIRLNIDTIRALTTPISSIVSRKKARTTEEKTVTHPHLQM